MKKGVFHISKFKPSILQGKLDFEAVSKRQTRALVVEYAAERLAFIGLSCILALLIFAYFYFVVGSVLNVISEKEADARSTAIQTTIGSLEQQYFSLSQSLTQQEASAMGLAPVQNTQYVYRPGDAASAPSSVHAI